MNSNARQRSRRGIEAVEAAVTLPLLALAVFATVQISHRWHIEKMLQIASYEAIKAGAAVDGSSEIAVQVFERHAAALGIQGAELLLDQRSFDFAEPGDPLEVEGRAPSASNEAATPHVIVVGSDVLSGGQIKYYKEGI